MQQQRGKLTALLHQVYLRQPSYALIEAIQAQQFTKYQSRIIEAQRLVEIAYKQIFLSRCFCHNRFLLFI
jgi:hypothetical protein